MKNFYHRSIAISLCLFFFSLFLSAQSGIYESYVILNSNGAGNQFYDLHATTGNPDFEGFDLGTFENTNSLILNGAENKTYKCGTDNIINGWLDYRIYSISDTPPVFSSNQILYLSDIAGGNGGCQNQLWRSTGANIDVINGLASGDYYLEVYTRADANYTGGSTVDFTLTENRGGLNFKASFRVDNPPTAICQAITVQLDASGNATILPSEIDNGSNDDFGSVSLALDIDTFDCTNIGTPVTVTLTVTDTIGQTSTCTAIVTVEDSIAPATPPLSSVTVDCSGTLTSPTTTDNCAGTITGTTTDTLAFIDGGSTIINWTFDDGNGNVISVPQTYNYDDTTDPVIPTLADVTVGQCSGTPVAPTTTDNCAGTITGTTTTSFPITTQGTTVVTWTFDDGNGNVVTADQNVIVDNTTLPITPILADVTGECFATATVPTTTDNCGVTITGTTSDPLTYNTQGTYIISWTFDDGNGNSITVNQNVIIDDVTPPVMPTLADVTVGQCSGTPVAPTTTDNCAGTISGTTTTTFPITTQGTTVVTWTFDDGNGNVVTADQNVIVDNTTLPITPILADVTGECSATATVPTTTDNCGVTITGTTSDPLTYNTQGTYIISWTFDDGNGNSITVNQNVIIDDVTPPVVPTLADVNVGQCIGTPATPTTTDNCSGTIPGTTTTTFPITTQGTTVVTWTFNDGNGNTVTQTQNIIITDTTAPVADVATLANVIAQCEVTTLSPPTATDNCTAVTVSHNATLPITAQGTTLVTWTYTDGNGNSSTQTQNVVITDTTAPVFTSCPSVISRNNDPGICGAIVNFNVPTATDNCGSVTVNQTDTTGLSSGSLFPIGTTTIEYTATDANGLTAICSFSITVIDSEIPTISCPTDVTVNADANCEANSVSLGTPTTNDNCGVATVTNDLAGQLPLPVGNHTVTWTVTDTAGLTNTCTQQVTVVDVTSPVITCPTPNAFYNTDAGQCDVTLTFTATATDNCNGTPLITYEIAGTQITFPYTFSLGTTNVVVIADDGNGLSSTCNFDVVVEDHEAPIAICQTIPFTITLDPTGNASIIASDIDNGSYDNCSTVTLSASQTAFTCANIGTNNVTLTVTDAAGNSSTCNTTVTVLDNVQGATATITSSPVSPICNGTPVTFTATGTNLGNNVHYQWYEGGIAAGTDGPTYTTIDLTNGEDVYVEITSGPCSTITTSNIIYTTVNPLLPVAFTLTPSANPACAGQNVTFFVTGLTNGGTPSYQWYVNGTPVGGNNSSYGPATYTNNDVVSVEVSSSLACGNPVPATRSVTMTVNPLPTVIAYANGSSSNIIICEGDNLLLTGGGATTYTWNNGVINNVSFVPAVGTYTYIVTGTSNTCQNTDSITVTVTPNATITLLSASADQSVCRTGGNPIGIVENIDFSVYNATTVSVTGLPTGVNGVYNAGLNRVRISGNPDNAVSGTFPYTITATGSCNTVTATGVITVYYGTPAEPGTINGTETFICPVTTAIYYVALDPNVETYNWTVPGSMTITNGQGTNQIEVSISGPFTFWQNITVTASNACGTSSIKSKRVIFNYSASVNIDAGNDIYVCEGTNIVTMDGYADGLSNTEWIWSDNGAGGTFSTVGTTNPPRYCTGFVIFGYCVGDWIYPPPRPIYSENSTYTLPPGAVAGDIITISFIADSGGFFGNCDDIVDNMRVHVIANPTAEFVTADAVCFGDSLTITGTPNTTVSFQFNGSSAGTFNIGNSGTVTFPNQPFGVYELTSIQYTNLPNSNGVGCVNTITGETVTINEPPLVTAPADITICEGDTVNLISATISGTNSNGVWSTSGNGTFSGNIYTLGATDFFNSPITLTYTNTPSDGICPGVFDSMLVTINQAPTIYAGVNQTVCSSDTVTMTGSLGGSATSGTWSGGTGTFSSNLPNATYTPGVGDTGNITLTYTSNDPSGPCGQATDTVVLTINPAAIVNAGADFTVCSTDAIVLSGTRSGSATSSTWSSSTGGTFTPNAGTLTATYNPSAADIANGSVTLTLTSNNPPTICNSGVDTVIVTINQAATVNAGIDITTCSNSTSVNLNATTNTPGQWTGGTGTFNNASSPTAIYTLGAGETSGTITLTYTTGDPDGAGPCGIASDSVLITVVPFVNATASNTTTISDCSVTTINLTANGTGTWTAVSVPSGSPFTFSSTTNPNATFTGESGTTYQLTWTKNNTAPCANDPASFDVIFPVCGDFINFDGVNDNVDLGNNYNLTGSFSIEAWIKPNVINGNIKTILSKRNASNLSTGYDLRLVNNNIIFSVNGSNLSTGSISANRWYHIAVTFNGSQYTLYVDGVQRNSSTGLPNLTSNSFDMRLGAMSNGNSIPVNYYNGWMDEVRIWNTALSVDQIRMMMNQEIENDGGLLIGSITGNQVPTGLNWTNLLGYYQMNQSTADINGGNLVANVGVTGSLRNMTTNQDESAPLPYISSQNGPWTTASTWLNNNVQVLPNTGTTTWNIVRTEHDININTPIYVLGLVVANNKLSVINDQPLYVNKYLKIDGTLDLVGESQLLQPEGSIVDYSGTGTLERDQQGSGNYYNYNYWGSPVSTAGAIGSRTFALDDILSNVLSWTSGLNGSTTPLTISTRWLYTFENFAFEDDNGWNPINQTTPINVGLGYLMKGTGPRYSPDQNYTFKGQPNNGLITIWIDGPGLATLVGNPYPSAIDADLFIDDNENTSLDGALTFWEQAPDNNSHYLAAYLGGYSAYNFTGAISGATFSPGTAGVGNAAKLPEKYIPVGQGFFVTGDGDGGPIIFRNSQRIFKKEGDNSIFIRGDGTNSTSGQTPDTGFNNAIQRVRLGMRTPEGATRHLLLGFTPNNAATDAADYGYDALNSDDFPSDASFIIGDKTYVIQGVGAFDDTKQYPFALKLAIAGPVEFAVTDFENFDTNPDVYIYDSVLGTYHAIDDTSFIINLEAGTYDGRFFLTFQEDQTLSNIDNEFKDITVKYLQGTNEIYISTPGSIHVKQVYMINIAGQVVKAWNSTNTTISHEMKIPVKDVSEGNYIIKIQTDTNNFNKKIIVKYK